MTRYNELDFGKIHSEKSKTATKSRNQKAKKLSSKTMKAFIFQWSGRQDLNLRPLVPQTSALPDCATPRTKQGGFITLDLGCQARIIHSLFFICAEKDDTMLICLKFHGFPGHACYTLKSLLEKHVRLMMRQSRLLNPETSLMCKFIFLWNIFCILKTTYMR